MNRHAADTGPLPDRPVLEFGDEIAATECGDLHDRFRSHLCRS